MPHRWQIILALAVVSAQVSERTHANASQSAAPAATGTISGTVFIGESHVEVVRNAVVRLTGGPAASARLVRTDHFGRFVFSGLPAGRFYISATKVGNLPAFHGVRRPSNGPGVPIALALGQHATVTLSMLRGAAIAGAIRDARGQPAPLVVVTAIRSALVSPAISNAFRAVTDDTGAYRIWGLPPGQYIVLADVPADLRRVGVFATTDAEINWARRISGTSIGSIATAEPAPGPVTAFAPVYYPGTTDPSGAREVLLSIGEEAAGLDFAVQMVPTARIGGRLIDPAGQPVSAASVSLYPRLRQHERANVLISSGMLRTPTATITPRGFTIAGVAPGDYTLVARNVGTGRAPAGAQTQPTLWAQVDLTVDGRDQLDLVIPLQRGTSVSGTLVMTPKELSSALMSRTQIALVATTALPGMPVETRTAVAEDGTFRFTGVAPGSYVFKATPPIYNGGQLWLKSAIINGRDVAELPLTVGTAQEISGLNVQITNRMSELSGTLTEGDRPPTAPFSIVVFPVDRALWAANSRRIRSVTLATDGTFVVRGLPDGEYAIVAVEEPDVSSPFDTALLSTLLPIAVKVRLRDGEQVFQALKVRR